MIPGEFIIDNDEIELNAGRKVLTLKISNIGDRPVQVGSHYHFFEVNKLLKFDRAKAYGTRLNIPSGTSCRFEPGEEKEVELTELGGNKRSFGLNALTNNQVNSSSIDESLKNAELKSFI